MQKLRAKATIFSLVLLLCFTLVSATANMIVMKYDVDAKRILKGDVFALSLSLKRVGDAEIGSDLTFVNTSSQVFEMTDGNRALKIDNTGDAFDVQTELKYLGGGNVFSFDIVDDQTGETVLSDSVVINQIEQKKKDDGYTPPVDSTSLQPRFEVVGQPFSGSFVTSKQYALKVKLENASNYIAKNVVATLGAEGDVLPFDLSKSTLSESQKQIMPNEEGEFVYDFKIDPTATSKIYKFTLNVSSKNSHGSTFSQSIPVQMQIDNSNRPPQVSIVEQDVEGDYIAKNTTKKVTLTLSNGGTLTAKDVEISLSDFAMEGFNLEDDYATKYIGDIGAGQRALVEFNLKAMPQAAGVATLTAKIDYNDLSGKEYSNQSQLFISTGTVQLSSDIEVEFEREQYNISAGQTIDVKVSVHNKSDRQIDDLKLNVQAENLQMMSTYLKIIESIAADETLSFSFSIAANETTAQNTYPLRAEVSSAAKSDAEQVFAVAGITVEEANDRKGKPRVTIDGYDYGGDAVLAGKQFPLTVKFKNTSSSMGIKNVKAVYQSDDNTFIPVDASNAIFIEAIDAGATVEKTVVVKTKNDAAPKTYTLDFVINYEDQNGNAYDAKDNPYEEKERISINLKQENRLEISPFMVPDGVMVGEPINLDINFFNMGKSTMYNMLVTMEGNFEARDATSYVGNFEPGKSEYYSATIIPTEPGEASGKIIFSYEDSNGEKESVEKEIAFTVMEGGMIDDGMFPDEMKPDFEGGMPEDGFMPGEAGGSIAKWQWIVGAVVLLIVIVVIVVLIKRRNKKRKEKLLEIEDEVE